MGIVTILVPKPTEVPLIRAHKMYGTAPDTHDRVVTINRKTLKYICSSMIVSGSFSSSGLAESLVGDNNLISIALDDTTNLPALVLDYTQIGT